MHPHPAKVVSEARFEIAARRCVQWLPRRTQRRTHAFGRSSVADVERCRLLLNVFLHHLIGDAVRVMLQRIIDSAHLESGEARHRSGGSPVGRGAQDGAGPRAIGLGLRPAGGADRRRDRPAGPARGGNVARDARLHGSRFLPSCASVDRAACSFTQTPKYRITLASAISTRPTAVRTISCSLVDLICDVERLYTAAGGDDHAPRAKPGGVVVL